MGMLSLGLSYCLAVSMLGAEVASTSPSPPADAALARYAPENCLFYIAVAEPEKKESSSGKEAQAGSKGKNHTEALCAEPEIQESCRLSRECHLRMLRRCFDEEEGGARPLIQDLDGIKEVATDHPYAVFLARLTLKEPGGKRSQGKEAKPENDRLSELADRIAQVEAGMVVSLGADAAAARKAWQECYARYRQQRASHAVGGARPIRKEILGLDIQEQRIGDGTWYRVRLRTNAPWLTCGFHGENLLIGLGDKAIENMLAQAAKKERPRWWKAIEEQLPVERRCFATYVDFAAFLKLGLARASSDESVNTRALLELLGLANVKTMVEAAGLEGTGWTDRLLLATEGQPGGLLGLLTQRPLRPEDVAAIPSDATVGMAFHLDLTKGPEAVVHAFQKVIPGLPVELSSVPVLRDVAGQETRNVLRALGDTWCFYESPGECAAWILTVGPVRDRAVLEAVSKKLAAAFPSGVDRSAENSVIPGFCHFPFQGHEIFCLNCQYLAPAWCVTDREVVFALAPQNIKGFLTRDKKERTFSRMPRVARTLASDNPPTALFYYDSKRIFEAWYPLQALLGPAVANRTQAPADVADALAEKTSPGAWSRHLRPGLLTLQRTKHGVEMVDRGTLPFHVTGVIQPFLLSFDWLHDSNGLLNRLPIPMANTGSGMNATMPPAVNSYAASRDRFSESAPAGVSPSYPSPPTRLSSPGPSNWAPTSYASPYESSPPGSPYPPPVPGLTLPAPAKLWHSGKPMPVLGPYRPAQQEDDSWGWPSEEAIKQWLEGVRPTEPGVRRVNLRVTFELTDDHVGPLVNDADVGPARMHILHYQGTVSFTEIRPVVPAGAKAFTLKDEKQGIEFYRSHYHRGQDESTSTSRPPFPVPVFPDASKTPASSENNKAGM